MLCCKAVINIKVVNPHNVEKGVISIKLKGEPIDGMAVPCQSAGSINTVEVIMG